MSQHTRKVYNIWSVSECRRKMKIRSIEYKGGRCSRCGYAKSYAALEFHHIDSTTKAFSLSTGNCRRWEVIKVELDKCVLLCANCHREEHESVRQKRLSEQYLQARTEVSEKVDGRLSAICAHCAKPFQTTKGRASRSLSSLLYCNPKCFSDHRAKALWPKDAALAELVWKQPATKLAIELGISSSAIKKHCKLRGIPTPPRGYWAKT
jgi:hypothetical protein